MLPVYALRSLHLIDRLTPFAVHIFLAAEMSVTDDESGSPSCNINPPPFLHDPELHAATRQNNIVLTKQLTHPHASCTRLVPLLNLGATYHCRCVPILLAAYRLGNFAIFPDYLAGE
ncbi:unnamed protein product [Protopolystoma xenopodis]|uniref:Uncharacterized protein n=1 Tax=Protopolystoma xenopodis TaxID=117903 RepID=A0A3S5CIA2_9PLAT|nr:unnamed protein product [Protopolystoma xenopodis]